MQDLIKYYSNELYLIALLHALSETKFHYNKD